MPKVVVVEAAGDDRLAAFRSLLAKYQTDLPEDLRVPDLDEELLSLPERYARGALLLAYDDERPIGCVVLHARDATTGEIKRLYVVPEARGTGAGKALTEAAIAAARNRGCARVVLDTHRDRLVAAYALYRSLGFVECDAYDTASYACPTFLELTL